MKHKISILFGILILAATIVSAQQVDFITPYEKSEGLETATYHEVVDFYSRLSQASPRIRMTEVGITDSGYPLHLVMYAADSDFDVDKMQKPDKRVILINNGIHPGEPCGVDASMMFFRDLAFDSVIQEIAGNSLVAAIPMYNIGGALNRGPSSRMNQVGPVEHGFRGNARNFDLNRDFIKQDTRNARSFATIFQMLMPDVFLDTHTSNGADYQHIMTLVEGQADKLGGDLGSYYRNEFLPLLYENMNSEGFPMVPYVQTLKQTPDYGIAGFYDSPRYSSGYAALFQTIAMISEAHMLKTFRERVASTYALIKSIVKITNDDNERMGRMRDTTLSWVKKKKEFALHWTLDKERYSEVEFNGYEAGYKTSQVSGLDRLYYDRTKPWIKNIKHYNYYNPVLTVTKPVAYLIPRGWHNVIENLKRNGVVFDPLDQDSLITVGIYKIKDYKTRERVYEGHYLHYDVVLEKHIDAIQFHKGDFIAYTDQRANRYLVETLEPQGYDSFFVWNYFDTVLQMKEYFSPYVFEDIAAGYLATHPELESALKSKKNADDSFAKSAWAQLRFVYERMPDFEPVYMRYPVYRWPE